MGCEVALVLAVATSTVYIEDSDIVELLPVFSFLVVLSIPAKSHEVVRKASYTVSVSAE